MDPRKFKCILCFCQQIFNEIEVNTRKVFKLLDVSFLRALEDNLNGHIQVFKF